MLGFSRISELKLPLNKVRDLFVYLNTNCNLECKYCNSNFLYQNFENKYLDFELFREKIFEVIKFNNNIPITFYGGEPLLCKNTLYKCIEYLISVGIKPHNISVFTNGTLIDETFSKLVKKIGFNLIISLDGTKEDNDINRVFKSRKDSVYEKVIENITKYDLKNFSIINMLITPITAENFHLNSLHMIKFAPKGINWDIDAQQLWSNSDLEKLKISFTKLEKYLIKIHKKLKKIPINISNLEINRIQVKKRKITITLMNDGFFYFCDYNSVINDKFIKKELKYYTTIAKKVGLFSNVNDFYCGFGFYYSMKKRISKKAIESYFINYINVKNTFYENIKQLINRIYK